MRKTTYHRLKAFSSPPASPVQPRDQTLETSSSSPLFSLCPLPFFAMSSNYAVSPLYLLDPQIGLCPFFPCCVLKVSYAPSCFAVSLSPPLFPLYTQVGCAPPLFPLCPQKWAVPPLIFRCILKWAVPPLFFHCILKVSCAPSCFAVSSSPPLVLLYPQVPLLFCCILKSPSRFAVSSSPPLVLLYPQVGCAPLFFRNVLKWAARMLLTLSAASSHPSNKHIFLSNPPYLILTHPFHITPPPSYHPPSSNCPPQPRFHPPNTHTFSSPPQPHTTPHTTHHTPPCRPP